MLWIPEHIRLDGSLCAQMHTQIHPKHAFFVFLLVIFIPLQAVSGIIKHNCTLMTHCLVYS